MSDACCGGCGGTGHEPKKKELPVLQEFKPEQGQKQKQEQKQDK